VRNVPPFEHDFSRAAVAAVAYNPPARVANMDPPSLPKAGILHSIIAHAIHSCGDKTLLPWSCPTLGPPRSPKTAMRLGMCDDVFWHDYAHPSMLRCPYELGCKVNFVCPSRRPCRHPTGIFRVRDAVRRNRSMPVARGWIGLFLSRHWAFVFRQDKAVAVS
jgi:hypothetical protein